VSHARARFAELAGLFEAGLAAVDAGSALRRAVVVAGGRLELDGEPVGDAARLAVLAVGKAAGPMAAALEEVAGERIAGGIVVTKVGHGVPLRQLALREAAHPVPDARSLAAGREALAWVAELRPEDVLVVLLSGGASSLLSCPAAGLSLAELAETTRLLLAGGADIEQTNAVRKHLSALAGGQLARLASARRIHVLVVSDVPGDRLDVIGSGPFAPDPTSYGDALAALSARGIAERVPPRVREHLAAGARGERAETPKPGDAAFARVRHRILATNRTALDAVCAAARRSGLRTRVLPALRGEARQAGARLARQAEALRGEAPLLGVAGGETAVTVVGRGRGGRSQELALAAAIALEGRAPTALLAGGTDGSDGPTEAAGAFADEGTLERARRRGLDAGAALDDNDSHGFFAALGELLVTGPTRTNVMDLALVRVDPSPGAGSLP
jgi:glycerate-2-kinase